MTHKSRLWKQPDLISQYELYRESNGVNVNDFPDLLEEASPRHIHDLVVEARGLLRRRGGSVYSFSGATVGHVAQYDVAPGLSQRLDGASVAYNQAEDAYVFTRLYDRRTSLRDTLRRYELRELAREYEDEFMEGELDAQEAVSEFNPADFLRRTDVLFHDAYLTDESRSTDIWNDGSSAEHRDLSFYVADYMALGYLLEYDGLIERPNL
jgi:hypothetical protein